MTARGKSLYWAGLNEGKRSLAVDTRSPEGCELIVALITSPGEGNGIFLTNFPTSGWLGYDALRQRRDDLIMMNVTGNPDGSSAVDYTVNCALGFPFVTGPAHGAAAVNPVDHVLPAWDAVAGVTAALGILAAERHRRLTSAGQLVKLPLADVAFAMTGNLVFAFGGLLTLSLSRLLSAIRLKCLQRLQIHLARLGQVRDVLMFVDLLATRFDSRQRKFGRPL